MPAQAIRSARLGASNAIGHMIGNTGLLWGFGRYVTVSNYPGTTVEVTRGSASTRSAAITGVISRVRFAR